MQLGVRHNVRILFTAGIPGAGMSTRGFVWTRGHGGQHLSGCWVPHKTMIDDEARVHGDAVAAGQLVMDCFTEMAYLGIIESYRH